MSRLVKQLIHSLHVLVVLVSVALVVIISIDVFAPDIDFVHNSLYRRIQLPVCLVYLADFFVGWATAARRRRFFFTHLVLLVLSVPYSFILGHISLHLPGWLSWGLHFMPAARAVLAMAIIVTFATRDRVFGLFISYSTVLILTDYFASLVFYIHEAGTNPAVTDYWEALWFAIMETTTLGATFYPVTTEGKAVAIICSGMGILMLPVFTAYLTNAVKSYVGNSRAATENS